MAAWLNIGQWANLGLQVQVINGNRGRRGEKGKGRGDTCYQREKWRVHVISECGRRGEGRGKGGTCNHCKQSEEE